MTQLPRLGTSFAQATVRPQNLGLSSVCEMPSHRRISIDEVTCSPLSFPMTDSVAWIQQSNRSTIKLNNKRKHLPCLCRTDATWRNKTKINNNRPAYFEFALYLCLSITKYWIHINVSHVLRGSVEVWERRWILLCLFVNMSKALILFNIFVVYILFSFF